MVYHKHKNDMTIEERYRCLDVYFCHRRNIGFYINKESDEFVEYEELAAMLDLPVLEGEG